MSFSWRLFIGITTAVLLTALVYSFLGYLSFQRSLEGNLEESFQSFKTAAKSSLDLTGSRPLFIPNDMTQTVFEEYSSSRFRVINAQGLNLEFGGSFPENAASYRFESLPLENNYALELAFFDEENRGALRSYLRTSFYALPAALAFALIAAFTLQRFLLRPLKALRLATTELSQQAIPEPILVPPGQDDLSQLALSFNRMTLSMQAFIERERGFTRYASHELRTPLSNLQVLIDGLEQNLKPKEQLIPQLKDNVKRMETILTGLLTLTRSPNLKPEPILLNQMIEQIAHELDKHKRIKLEFAASPIVLSEDNLLRQVLVNLIQNALKFSAKEVCVCVTQSAGIACLSIRDFGVGVPEESLDKLTEPFYRVDKRKQGLGLGLALVQHSVDAMRGSLSFQNAQPGLRVLLSLPLAHLDALSDEKEGQYV